MSDHTIRRYKLKTVDIYRRWGEQNPDRPRPVLKDLAAESGLSPNSLSAALRGVANVLPGTAERLASMLQCGIDDIAEPTHYTALMPKTGRKIVAITFAMDTQLVGDLNRRAQETGRNRSVLVREAVAQYLSRLG
jgi:transcriptional regulator with XRE-family HTH domain